MDIREAIIQEAESIILRKGFYTFRYKEIAERTRIPPADIHYHFPSKDDLGCVVIRRARLAFREWTKDADQGILNPLDKISAFFATYHSLLLAGDKICLAGILGAELNTLPFIMQNELRFYYMERQKWLEQVLSDGLYGGTFVFKDTVEERALFILASLQGGLQIARVNEDNDIFFAISGQLKAHLTKKQETVILRN